MLGKGNLDDEAGNWVERSEGPANVGIQVSQQAALTLDGHFAFETTDSNSEDGAGLLAHDGFDASCALIVKGGWHFQAELASVRIVLEVKLRVVQVVVMENIADLFEAVNMSKWKGKVIGLASSTVAFDAGGGDLGSSS